MAQQSEDSRLRKGGEPELAEVVGLRHLHGARDRPAVEPLTDGFKALTVIEDNAWPRYDRSHPRVRRFA